MIWLLALVSLILAVVLLVVVGAAWYVYVIAALAVLVCLLVGYLASIDVFPQ